MITRSDGQKFGKSVDGAVWLDPERTLPYEFHQYWMRTDDRDVERFLLQLTLLPLERIAEVMEEHASAPERRHAQRVLADEVTELIHGPDEVRRSNLAAGALFGGADLDAEALEALRGIVPETSVAADVLKGEEPVVELLIATGVCSSKGDARRTVDQGGIRLNGEKIEALSAPVAAVDGRFVLVQKGKKQRHLAVVEAEPFNRAWCDAVHARSDGAG